MRVMIGIRTWKLAKSAVLRLMKSIFLLTPCRKTCEITLKNWHQKPHMKRMNGMTEIGTLKELNVKPGDVVENQKGNNQYTITEDMRVGGCPVKYAVDQYRIISRAPDTPKLWRDMTDAEKGPLLLAFYNDKKSLEIWRNGEWVFCIYPYWRGGIAYRVKPEPKRVTVPLMADFKEIGTIDLVDGKPDFDSIKSDGAE